MLHESYRPFLRDGVVRRGTDIRVRPGSSETLTCKIHHTGSRKGVSQRVSQQILTAMRSPFAVDVDRLARKETRDRSNIGTLRYLCDL